MNARDVSPLHLTFNALGCAAVAAVSLTVAFTPAFTLTSIVPPRPNDPVPSDAHAEERTAEGPR